MNASATLDYYHWSSSNFVCSDLQGRAVLRVAAERSTAYSVDSLRRISAGFGARVAGCLSPPQWVRRIDRVPVLSAICAVTAFSGSAQNHVSVAVPVCVERSACEFIDAITHRRLFVPAPVTRSRLYDE